MGRNVEVRSQEMPGIGQKFEIGCVDGGRIAVIIQNNGLRDIYSFEPGAAEPDSTMQVSDAQARALGAILTGVYYQPTVVDDMDDAIGDLAIEWLALPRTAAAVGQSIGALGLRATVEVVLVAVIRQGRAIIAPGDAELLEVGDRVVLAGRRRDLLPLRQRMLGHGA